MIIASNVIIYMIFINIFTLFRFTSTSNPAQPPSSMLRSLLTGAASPSRNNVAPLVPLGTPHVSNYFPTILASNCCSLHVFYYSLCTFQVSSTVSTDRTYAQVLRNTSPSRAPAVSTSAAVEAPTTVVAAPAPTSSQAVRIPLPTPIPAPRQSVGIPLSTPIPAPRRAVRHPLTTPVADTVVSSSSSDDEIIYESYDEEPMIINDEEPMIISDDEPVDLPATRQQPQ